MQGLNSRRVLSANLNGAKALYFYTYYSQLKLTVID